MARTPAEADRSSSADRAISAGWPRSFADLDPYRRVIAGLLPAAHVTIGICGCQVLGHDQTFPSSETKSRPVKQSFHISRKDGLPLTFAGLWEKWKDGMLSFTILTTEAYEGIRDLHTCTPMILDGQGRKSWLNPPALAGDIDTAIYFYPVSTRVNKPSYDAPDCIESLT